MYTYHLVPHDEDGQCYTFTAVAEPINEALTWCEETYGEPLREGRWTRSYFGTHIWIRSHEDAVAFRLRWC